MYAWMFILDIYELFMFYVSEGSHLGHMTTTDPAPFPPRFLQNHRQRSVTDFKCFM